MWISSLSSSVSSALSIATVFLTPPRPIAINDMRHVQSQVEYEMLIRGLLALPNKPAIVNVQ